MTIPMESLTFLPLDPEAESLVMAYAREMKARIIALGFLLPYEPLTPSAVESGYAIAQLIGRARAAQIVTKETPQHDRNH